MEITMTILSILRSTALAGAITLGLGMQAANAEPLVYVPLGDAGKIVVVDAATDKIVDTIGGLAAIHGLAKTPDGKFLIAGSYDEREAGTEMPAKPANMTKKDHAAHHKAAPAKSPNSDKMVSTVSVVSTSDGKVVRRIDVPGAVHHVTVSPDGRFAVVTHPNEDAVSAIDLASYKVVATVPTGSLPNYAAFSPDGKRLFVSNAGGNTVSEINTASWAVDRQIKVSDGPGHLAMSPDGRNLYVASDDDGIVSEINIRDGMVARTFTIGDSLHGLDLSKDGGTLFVSARGKDKLVAIDLKTSAQRDVTLAPEPYHLATIGSTGKLYVSSADQPDIWVVDQKSLSVTGIVPIGGKGHQMVLSPGS